MRLLNLEQCMTKEPMVSNPQIYCIGDSHASICIRALEHGLAYSPCDGLWMHKRF